MAEFLVVGQQIAPVNNPAAAPVNMPIRPELHVEYGPGTRRWHNHFSWWVLPVGALLLFFLIFWAFGGSLRHTVVTVTAPPATSAPAPPQVNSGRPAGTTAFDSRDSCEAYHLSKGYDTQSLEARCGRYK